MKAPFFIACRNASWWCSFSYPDIPDQRPIGPFKRLNLRPTREPFAAIPGWRSVVEIGYFVQTRSVDGSVSRSF